MTTYHQQSTILCVYKQILMIRLLHILVIVSLPIWVTGKAEQQLVRHLLVLAQYLSITILGNDVFIQ